MPEGMCENLKMTAILMYRRSFGCSSPCVTSRLLRVTFALPSDYFADVEHLRSNTKELFKVCEVIGRWREGNAKESRSNAEGPRKPEGPGTIKMEINSPNILQTLVLISEKI